MANGFCKQLIVNQSMMTTKIVMIDAVCWQKRVIMNAVVTRPLPVMMMIMNFTLKKLLLENVMVPR